MEIGSLGVPELLIILVVVLLLFGPRRLPEVARGLGKAVHDFRSSLQSGVDGVVEESRGPSRGDPEPRRSAAVAAPEAPASSAAALAEAESAPESAGEAAAATPGRDH